jgi:hypothetical protein
MSMAVDVDAEGFYKGPAPRNLRTLMAQLLLRDVAMKTLFWSTGKRDVIRCWAEMFAGGSHASGTPTRRLALSHYLRGGSLDTAEWDFAFDVRDGDPELSPHSTLASMDTFHAVGDFQCCHCKERFATLEDVIAHVKFRLTPKYFYRGFVMMKSALSRVHPFQKETVLKMYLKHFLDLPGPLQPYLFSTRFRVVAEKILSSCL